MAQVDGTAGNDSLTGTDSADLISGFGGNDTLDGGLGADTLNGGDGNDTFSFSSVLSTTTPLPFAYIDGGAGQDVVDASRVSPVSVSAATSGLQLQVGTQIFILSNIEAIITDLGANNINIGSQTRGMRISTGEGADYIQAGPGSDTIDAGTGDDILFVETPDWVNAGAGNDFVFVSGGLTTGSYATIDGGEGIDTLWTNIGGVVSLASSSLSVSNGGLAYIRNFENVQASVSFGYEARVFGDDNPNVITADAGLLPAGVARFEGGGGADTLIGAGNNDVLLGGPGDDVLEGGAGDDRLDGGTGFDTVRMSAAGSVDLRVSGAQDTGSGRDTLSSIEGVQGSSARDMITGNGSANRLAGSAGDDTIDGRAGDDTVVGGTGNDTLKGGAGQDFIQGGDGEDYIWGGTGSDVIDGGSGQDVFILSGAATDYSVARLGNAWTVRANGDTDTISNIEFVQCGDRFFTMAQFEQAAFDPYSYLSSNPDLYAAFLSDIVKAQNHYITYGISEGRNTGDFDPLTYIASNPDLINALGPNPEAGFLHYMVYGMGEGRVTDQFDALEYLAANKDLSDAFGSDAVSATRHYITYGAIEGRATTFNADLYAASNADLARLFGTDERATLGHYIRHGRGEGRPVDTFDFRGYAAQNPDLSGMSRDALIDHWLTYGIDEGRSVDARPLTGADLGPGMTAMGKDDPYDEGVALYVQQEAWAAQPSAWSGEF